MTPQLDPSILADITRVARQCFLEEDAPGYIDALENAVQQRTGMDFTVVLRAAHSLKGGAGLAELPGLQNLAHKLEDVLKAVEQEQVVELEEAWFLIEQSVEEIKFLLGQAWTGNVVEPNSELIRALEIFNSNLTEYKPDKALETDEKAQTNQNNNDFISIALQQDLEALLAEIEEMEEDTPVAIVVGAISHLCEEGLFLGETLNLPWLVEQIEQLEELANAAPPDLFSSAKEIFRTIRTLRDRHLNGEENNLARQPVISDLIKNALAEDLENCLREMESLSLASDVATIQKTLANFCEELLFMGETLQLPWLISAIEPLVEPVENQGIDASILQQVNKLASQIRQQRDSYLTTGKAEEGNSTQAKYITEQNKAKITETKLRIPLHRLEGMSSNVEELILIKQRLNLQKQLLKQANLRLNQLTKQFEPIREQVQTVYNQVSTKTPQTLLTTNLSEEINSQTENFDSLELDRYSELHTSLQSFQELMLLITETRRDLDLIHQDLTEDLEQVDKNLNSLYSNVTDSRLVPFQILARRFFPQIQNLNRRFDKQVNLTVVGEDTLVDQILLEQLQTPLTHLINNAFDHGIENPTERITQGKSESASIVVTANTDNNQLVITIADDGRGIDTRKIYQKAVKQGICPPEKSIEDFSETEIINWIFQPQFSTAASVSDLSGRGMGLDIVRDRISALRGKIQVNTQLQQGTTFTLKLPLNLSLVSLLLVQCKDRIIALPSTSIKAALLTSELQWQETETNKIYWQKQLIPLVNIANLLPCPLSPIQITQSQATLILNTGEETIAVLVDSLVSEGELIVKPFDNTIPIPSYLAGCTILGNGEIVPVILPEAIDQQNITSTKLITSDKSKETYSDYTPTIVVAEDSVAARRILEKILTLNGYNVILCRDGKEASQYIQQNAAKLDLVISDVEMPRMNGFELLQQIKTSPTTQHLPVIMATSRTGDRHVEKAMSLGANDYLGKPVQPQKLLATVESFLPTKVIKPK